MDKVILVTGAAKRIGATIASRFHQSGYRAIIHYNHSESDAQTLVQALNSQRADSAVAIQADLCDPLATEKLARQAASHFGHLDVLVNNASAFYPEEFGEITQNNWDAMIDSNVRAAFFLSQELSSGLSKRGGAIVNLVDTHADRPLPGFPTYSIAKAALKAMTKSLAIELAPHVRVNGVSPGAILWPPSLEDDSNPDILEKRKKMLSKIPLGRLGSQRDIAEAVFYLATEANYITGFTMKVDGGRSLS